jgi:hypothetical protein
MVRHPSTGWNLLMAGADLLDGGTGTACGITTVKKQDKEYSAKKA